MTPHSPVNASAYARTAIGLVAQSSAPTNPQIGQIYFDTDDNQLYAYGDTDPTALTVLGWSVVGAVSSTFGRTGAVVATAGDYTATQITSTSSGTLSATDVQTALDELDLEKQSTTLSNNSVLIGNASNVATAVTLSGDITSTNAGVLTIANSAVTLGKLAANAVDASKVVD